MSFVPMVVEQTNRGERSYDIFSRLLNDRVIILSEAAFVPGHTAFSPIHLLQPPQQRQERCDQDS